MCDLALAGRYAVAQDSEAKRCVVAHLRAGVFLLLAVIDQAQLKGMLRDLLDEERYDLRILIQRCAPDTASPGSARWLAHPHGLLSVWAEVDHRTLGRISWVEDLPECGWKTHDRIGRTEEPD